jgi:hypothetical protein
MAKLNTVDVLEVGTRLGCGGLRYERGMKMVCNLQDQKRGSVLGREEVDYWALQNVCVKGRTNEGG